MSPKKTATITRHLHKRLQRFPKEGFVHSIPRVRPTRVSAEVALRETLSHDFESNLALEVDTTTDSGYGCGERSAVNLGELAGRYPDVLPTQELSGADPTPIQLDSDQNAQCEDYRTFNNVQTAQPSLQPYALPYEGSDLVHLSTGWAGEEFNGDPSHIPYGRTHGRASGVQNHFANQAGQGNDPQTGHSISGTPALQFGLEEFVRATRASEMWPCQWPSQGPASVGSVSAAPRETQITNLHGPFVQVAWVPNGIPAMESSNGYPEGIQFSSGGVSSYQEPGRNVWPSGNAD
ncbi:hypothetical protein BDN70DRAFT_894383 [Pholiota conissans]|uniref:Uncharacterized protein n=1 Tax=Pholiota conissans TaxID=109636 RepID=A0A9P6D213_9AGAR|nr:hypothetical protein BDN70DRAFT_894383 [Pholiota conissans]